jgi:plastocyanin
MAWRRGLIAGALSGTLCAAALVAVHAPPAGAVAGGAIVFASERDGVSEASGLPAPEIYSMDISGASVTRLTDNDARDENPALSPDGSKIAFTSHRDGNDEIYVMDVSGANQTRLTTDAGSDGRPAWSPDGAQIVFVSNRNGEQEIFVMDAVGTNQSSLNSLAAGDNNPAWSPDGTKIAFDRVGIDHNCEIYVVTLATNTAVNLTNSSACDAEPAWSPDGTKIAFRSLREANSELYVMSSSGASQTRLTTNTVEDGSPSWSPDGTKIAFARCCAGATHAASIYTMNSNGSSVTGITSAAVDAQPDWGSSPPAAGLTAEPAAVVPPAAASSASATALTTDSVSTWSARFMGSGLPATTTEAQNGAARFDVIAAQPWTFRGFVADPMKTINPDLVLLGYVNAVMIPKTAVIRYPESWYARDANGNKIQSRAYATYLMDPSLAAWQATAAQSCTSVIASSGYDGCLLDVLGTFPTKPGFATALPINPATGNAWTQQDYLAATTQLAGTVRSAVTPSPVYGNGLQAGTAYFSATNPSAALLNGLDGGMVELWMRNPQDKVTTYRTPSAWKADVDMLVDMENKAKPMLALTKAWDTAATTAQLNALHKYALASFLLGTNGLSQFSFLADEDAETPTLDHPWWHTDIGTPVAPYAPVSGKANLYQRAWTNGRVYVNADPAATYTVSLGGSYRTLEGQTVSSLTLGPHGAQILTPAPPSSVVAVSIGATAYTPATANAAQGKTVEWTNNHSSNHTIVDSSGMALFGGSAIAPSNTYSFVFTSAGGYAYRDAVTTSMTGKVTVPLVLAKSGSSSVTVTWAASAPPGGYAADIQVRLPGAANFVNWRSAQTGTGASYTRPANKSGQFRFRARLRNAATGKASLWSPVSTITLG